MGQRQHRQCFDLQLARRFASAGLSNKRGIVHIFRVICALRNTRYDRNEDGQTESLL